MAFAWTSVNDGTKVTAAHWNEVKTNVDTIISNLGISAYSWSELPVTQGVSKFEPAEVSDLRAALDYAHDNNTCSAENATYDSSNNPTNYDANDSDDNITLDSVVHTGDDSARDVNYDNSEDSTIYNPYYYSNENNEHTGYYSNKCTSVSDIRLKKDVVYI